MYLSLSLYIYIYIHIYTHTHHMTNTIKPLTQHKLMAKLTICENASNRCICLSVCVLAHNILAVGPFIYLSTCTLASAGAGISRGPRLCSCLAA